MSFFLQHFTALWALLLQTDVSAVVDGGKGFVLSSLAGSPVTTYLVAMIKKGYPAASSSAVMWSAFGCGVLSSFLITGALGTPMTVQTACLCVLGGMLAATTAMGVRSADNKADEKRENQPG